MCDYLNKRNTQGVNSNQFFGIWEEADAFRATLGQMINCQPAEIVYGQSSTALFNIFANGISLQPGDNVVTTDEVYHADAYVFLNLAHKGVQVRFAKTTAMGITPEELLSHADDRTKAVVVCMVENRSGFRHDMVRIGQLCRQRGILFAADATQCTNAFPIDVKAMQIDFLTTSLYKWMMGDQGHAFGYISRELLPNLAQSVCGWVGTQDRWQNVATSLQLSRDAKRF
jgi:selenocysteine lyase/cysteine desulfurase